MTAWWGCAATLVGAGHRARGRPGQDAAGTWGGGRLTVVADALGTTSATTSGDAADTVGAAVADGHGDPRHPRSGRGAVLAVQAAAEVLRSGVGDELPESLVRVWRRLVAADVQEEAEPLAGEAWTEYGTTLLAAAGTGSALVVVRVGDGEVGLVDDTGGHRSLPTTGPPTVGVTASLAGGGPAAVDVLDAVDGGVRAVWLATDGFTAAQAERGWRDVVAAQLHERLAGDRRADVAAQLPDWIAPAAADGGDDVSLALLVRSP